MQICGVKGPTVLAFHHSFDLVGGVTIDDLRGVYLGVTLSLLHLWFDRTNRGKPFFIGDKVIIERGRGWVWARDQCLVVVFLDK